MYSVTEEKTAVCKLEARVCGIGIQIQCCYLKTDQTALWCSSYYSCPPIRRPRSDVGQWKRLTDEATRKCYCEGLKNVALLAAGAGWLGNRTMMLEQAHCDPDQPLFLWDAREFSAATFFTRRREVWQVVCRRRTRPWLSRHANDSTLGNSGKQNPRRLAIRAVWQWGPVANGAEDG